MQVWFSDQTDGFCISCRVKAVLHHERSSYQEICVLDTDVFGRMLVLDDVIQTTERDEFTYHEMLVHVPLMIHPAPRRVAIIGGGDGGSVREVAKHPEVGEIFLVEIDARVVWAARTFLPTISCALQDGRVKILEEDGIAHMATKREEYDVIIVDAPDPVGAAVGLFSEEFYRSCCRALRPGGLMSAQVESPHFHRELVVRMYRTARRAFADAAIYTSCVPSYPGGYWAFLLASRNEPLSLDLRGDAKELETRYWTPEVHRAAFALPRFLQEALEVVDREVSGRG